MERMKRRRSSVTPLWPCAVGALRDQTACQPPLGILGREERQEKQKEKNEDSSRERAHAHTHTHTSIYKEKGKENKLDEKLI